MRSIAQFFIRIFAFVRKEIISILRQPRLVFSLILGPFIILLLFGVGYRETPRALRTLFVVPEDSPMLPVVEEYATRLGEQISSQGIISDPAEADRRLRAREVDLVVVVPPDPSASVRANEQAVFTLYHYEIDPYERTYIEILGRNYADEINRLVLITAADQGKVEARTMQEQIGGARQAAAAVRVALEAGNETDARAAAEQLTEDLGLLAVATGSGLALLSGVDEATGVETFQTRLDNLQQLAGTLAAGSTAVAAEQAQTAATIEADLGEIDTLLGEYQGLESQVLVSPFVAETRSISDTSLGPTDFFVPAVIALLMQHIAITLAGLSIVRERQDGPIELFRASPVSAFQTLVGKFISYLILTLILGAILTALVVYGLGVPMLGNWWDYALVMVALLCASLSLGFFLSLSAKTDSQAIQSAMVVLLASIFFGGFFLALYRLWEPVQVVSWALPVTYGINLLQSVMLRGQAPALLLLGGLFLYAVIFFLIDWWRLSRVMARQ
ncbi:putative ABC-2 type transporter [Candidatus Promineifilum breve]|uniref:ABC-2 type transporter n=1 Tax=Candidatus Promineifilum breve TaxID=1806508 RepID=A0A160T539_9CHLR|nr:ABC transporter permease [Candidatus Promineifilum breve]CUS03780.2 putative ABC-2 type transporter [Candidatus Promineifilum breve]